MRGHVRGLRPWAATSGGSSKHFACTQTTPNTAGGHGSAGGLDDPGYFVDSSARPLGNTARDTTPAGCQ